MILGAFSWSDLADLALAIFLIVVGLALGYAFLRLGAGRFRSVVLVVLAASSAVTMIRVVGG